MSKSWLVQRGTLLARRVWATAGAAWVLLLLAVLGVCAAASAAAPGPDRTVVVLLFDGWAPVFRDMVPTPALERMQADGVWTDHLMPVFPTGSLVNQASISTGCWPQHHGIVLDEFLDPERGRYDQSDDADWLTGCEHLHQVAERQGIRTAALGWIGRLSTTRGPLATYATEERARQDFPTDPGRAAQVIRFLRLPDDQRPRLILARFRGPYQAAHATGMDSEQTRAAVVESDQLVGSILDVIDALPFHEQVTLIVTTDHGMLPVWTNINIDRILRRQRIDVTAVSSGSVCFLYFPNPSDNVAIEAASRALAAYHQQFDVVRAALPPPEFHLGNSPRVGSLILSAVPPNFIEDLADWPWWAHWLGRWGPEFLWSRFVVKATQGYPPKTSGMPGILFARGAGVGRGRYVPSVRAIDLHPTVCHLLGIEPGAGADGEIAGGLLRSAE